MTDVNDSAPAPADDVAPAEATDDTAAKLVPVTEAIRDRQRALAAEQQLDETRSQTESLQGELDQARRTITSLERREQVDRLLADARVADLEVARLLTEMAVEQMDEPDIKLAVDDLRRHKPYLFHASAERSSAMAARGSDRETPARHAAQQAADTGNRRDLLHYLRMRRRTP